MNNFIPNHPGFNQFTEPAKEPRFKVSSQTYMTQDTSYRTNNIINAYYMRMKAHEYTAIDMLSHCINNCNPSVLPSNPLRDEYVDEEDAEDQGTLYSHDNCRAICIKNYDKLLDVLSVFIFTIDGEAYLFTNDSLLGYYIMVDRIFGGEDTFKSCCTIIDKGVTNDRIQLVPFVNLLNSI
jgi:hypothetical protein